MHTNHPTLTRAPSFLKLYPTQEKWKTKRKQTQLPAPVLFWGFTTFWVMASLFSESRACTQSKELWQISLQNVFLIGIFGHCSNTNCEISHSHRQQHPELLLAAREAAPHFPRSSRSITDPPWTHHSNTEQTPHWQLSKTLNVCDQMWLPAAVSFCNSIKWTTVHHTARGAKSAPADTPQRMLSGGTIPAPN